MITYKDKAWCNESVLFGCGNAECFRNYTPEERKHNDDNVGLPLSISGYKSDDCGYKEPANE